MGNLFRRTGLTAGLSMLIAIGSALSQEILFKGTNGTAKPIVFTDRTSIRFFGCDTLKVFEGEVLTTTMIVSEIQNATLRPCESITAIDISTEILTKERQILLKAYPNPQQMEKGGITIEIQSKSLQAFTLRVYDLTGRMIKDFGIIEPTSVISQIVWNGTDLNGLIAQSGSYMIHAQANGNIATQLISITN